jgi:CO/xanthine dehydrogenase Mo-binding subunit
MERSYTLITAGNIPGKNELADFPVPILASEELSYLGEPIALLAGPDRVKLESYAAQCRIVVQEEKPVFAAPASAEQDSPAEMESFAERSLDRGDIDAAFAGAAVVVSAVYSTGIQEHCYGEAVGALAEYTGGGQGAGAEKNGEAGTARPLFTIYSAAQWPYHVRRSAAQVLGLEESQVVVEAADPGIPMDGKIWYPSLIACQAALAAAVTRRNVRLLLNREEDFYFSPKRNASITRIQSALGEGGEILGTRIDLSVDLGAQAVFCREILDQSCLGVLGIAEEGALSLRARALKTNIPPQGPFSGFGGAQGGFAMERHCSLIADSLETDPAEWRREHFSGGKGAAPPSRRAKAPEAPVEQILDAAAAMADYYRKWGSYELLRRRRREDPPPARRETLRGVGIALGRQGNGFLHIGEGGFTVEAVLNIDGSLEIRTSAKVGKDFIHIWSNIARETLGVEEDKVRVVFQNTALCPDSGPESLSRNITSLSFLVERCCQAVRNQRFRDPLPITVRESSGPRKTGSRKGSGKILPLMAVPNPESQERPGRAASVVEVEIEPSSCSPVIRGVWLAVDGGRILSESRARRSLKLAAVQALGWASSEYLLYREGAVEPGDITDYGIFNPSEIPPIRIDFLRNDAVLPRGIGELPFCCIPAAYLQAVSQALDYPFEHIPLRPGDIWEILKPGPRPEEGGGPEPEAAK